MARKAKDGAEGSAGHPRTKCEAVKMGLIELGVEAKPPRCTSTF